MGAEKGDMLAGEGEHLFLYVKYSISLICIASKFHQDDPQGYLVMFGTRAAVEIYQRDVDLKHK